MVSLKLKNSQKFSNKVINVIPNASQTFSKSLLQYPRSFSPQFFKKGKGCYLWDVDNNKYIDLVSALLPIILGYSDIDVNREIKKQLNNGITFSMPNLLEFKLAKELIKIIPSAEMVKFGKNGSDVTSAAIRLSRAYTKKDYVIRVGYHGWHEWHIASTTRNKGIPKEYKKLTLVTKYNDIKAVRKIIDSNKKIAAIILEPMSFERPINNYLMELRKLCTKNNIVLIFDEIITGFRFHIGGAQKLFNVTPDLSTFGKAIANGMPISALVGKKKIMKEMDEIFFSGTFGGECLSIVAALATIEKLKSKKIISKIWKNGAMLKKGINQLIKKYDFQNFLYIKGEDPWFVLFFKDNKKYSSSQIKTYYTKQIIKYGVFTNGTHNINYCHNPKIINKILNAYEKTFKDLKNALLDNNLNNQLQNEEIKPIFKVR